VGKNGAPADMKERAVRLLVVEDNPADVVLTRRLLESASTHSFEISDAATLSAAFEELRRGVDAVLLDLNLPDSQDLVTLQRLRAEHPSVPIIVVTGLDDRQKAVEALSNGANDYFVKEKFDVRLLTRAILRALKPKAVR